MYTHARLRVTVRVLRARRFFKKITYLHILAVICIHERCTVIPPRDILIYTRCSIFLCVVVKRKLITEIFERAVETGGGGSVL